jgi:pilus assembly protein Flp/PilA
MISRIKDLYCWTVRFLTGEEGQTLVEYALLLVLIAFVVIAMLKGVGIKVDNTYSRINSAMP